MSNSVVLRKVNNTVVHVSTDIWWTKKTHHKFIEINYIGLVQTPNFIFFY